MDRETLVSRIAFASQRSLSLPAARELLARTGSEQRYFSLSTDELRSLTGSKNSLWDADRRARLIDEARREIEFIERNSVRCIYFTDPEYPQRLLNCDDAPLMLYALGRGGRRIFRNLIDQLLTQGRGNRIGPLGQHDYGFVQIARKRVEFGDIPRDGFLGGFDFLVIHRLF